MYYETFVTHYNSETKQYIITANKEFHRTSVIDFVSEQDYYKEGFEKRV